MREKTKSLLFTTPAQFFSVQKVQEKIHCQHKIENTGAVSFARIAGFVILVKTQKSMFRYVMKLVDFLVWVSILVTVYEKVLSSQKRKIEKNEKMKKKTQPYLNFQLQQVITWQVSNFLDSFWSHWEYNFIQFITLPITHFC